jgi:hypothetical protein
MPDQTRIASIKGRLRELGPRLDLAPDHVYVGRCCKRGGWDLPQSPYRNPFTVTTYGFDGALERYRLHLVSRPDLVERARAELTGRVLCCFCTDLSRCHCAVLAEACDTPGVWPAPVLTDCGDEFWGRSVPVRPRETVRLSRDLAHLL